jgi:hypothetical protein
LKKDGKGLEEVRRKIQEEFEKARQVQAVEPQEASLENLYEKAIRSLRGYKAGNPSRRQS